MDKAIIHPSVFKLPPLEKSGILFFILQHFYMFHNLVNGSKIKSYGPAKRFSFEKDGRKISVLGGMIGAPLAVIVVEIAMASGMKHFRSFGTTGWVSDKKQTIGALVNPAKGKDETGMIKDYGGQSDYTTFECRPGVTVCENIVTVNSFFRLTNNKIGQYRKQQIEIIDMEAVPLNHVILNSGGTYQPLFVVSDRVDEEFKWENGSRSDQFLSGLNEGLNLLASDSFT